MENPEGSLSNGHYTSFELQDIFDTQLGGLEDTKVPSAILDQLRSHRKEVLAKVEKFQKSLTKLPFIPMITREDMELEAMVARVTYNGKGGTTQLSWGDIGDGIRLPFSRSCFMLDVEVGMRTRGAGLDRGRVIIGSQGRTWMTTEGILGLATHTDVLESFNLEPAGSWHSKEGSIMVPTLFTSGNQAKLELRTCSAPGDRSWGAPSYGRLI